MLVKIAKSSNLYLYCDLLQKYIISLFSWQCINFLLYQASNGMLVINVSLEYILTSAHRTLLFLGQPNLQTTFMVKIQRSLLTASCPKDDIFFISLSLFFFIKDARKLEFLQAYHAKSSKTIQNFLIY